MTTGWDHLFPAQKEASQAAARLVEDAEMRFVFLLFGHNGVGAVISNIEPGEAVKMIEGALMAAKANCDCDDITDGRERLQ